MSAEREVPPGGSIESLWRASGEDVGLIQGTSDYAPGLVRVSFLVIRTDGRSVERPRARVWLAAGLKEKPFQQGEAALEPIGVPGSAFAEHDVKHLYVTHVRVPKAGRYWLLAEPVGAKPTVQALGTLVVKAKSESPPVGARAVPSRTPTIASTGGDFAKLTTSSPPDRELLRHSVADTLAARKPFVVVFATPKYCTSRTCGPSVDVVDQARRDHADSGVRFIHVEIYEGNDPKRGVNRWVEEWSLPSEPWVFVVGRDGRIKAKFEGSVSVSELETALREIT
ncbi:MAG: hypothetical protein ACRDN6_08655 [Gaiellaceae bacterium]